MSQAERQLADVLRAAVTALAATGKTASEIAKLLTSENTIVPQHVVDSILGTDDEDDSDESSTDVPDSPTI